MGFFGRIREGLARTTKQIVDRFDEIVNAADAPDKRSRPVDVETVDALEELLISADLGVPATNRIIAAVKARSRNGASLRDLVKQEIRDVFAAVDRPIGLTTPPRVTLIVGVNGTGKTTTVGKLANLLKSQGKTPLICAADTFRAAAVEQLEIWAGRTSATIVRGKEGADPSSVIFEGIKRAAMDGFDVAIADTAGRLHTKTDLMQELQKIRRVVAKASPGAPHETWLVIDATSGQNAIAQAQIFTEAMAVSGIVLTKLDGTAKGGVILGIADQLKIPVRYVGIGERVEDLRPFDPGEFVDALFAPPNAAAPAEHA